MGNNNYIKYDEDVKKTCFSAPKRKNSISALQRIWCFSIRTRKMDKTILYR